MSNYIKTYFVLVFLLALITIGEESFGQQCNLTNYTLSPSGYLCGTSGSVTMSGSQVGVNYQLVTGNTKIGNPVPGTGKPLTWSNLPFSGGQSYAVFAVAITSGMCTISTTNPILAAPPTYINGASTLLASDIVLTVNGRTVFASDSVALYPGDSVVFTVSELPMVNPFVSIANCILFNSGTSTGITSTNYKIVINSLPRNYYSILVNTVLTNGNSNSACGSPMITCPKVVALPSHLSAGTVSSGSTLSLAGTTGGSGKYTYQWQSSVDNSTWDSIPSVTNASYPVPKDLSSAMYFRVRVNDGYETRYSNIVLVFANQLPNDPPQNKDFSMSGIIGADSVHIGKSNIVGSIAGSTSVSLAGAATYTIPINVLPGTNGMQPSVSVAYNSMALDGLLGWGWNLSALSTITRAGKNNYYDGITTQVNYTNDNDAFVLDGQRLMVASGTNGANGAIYGTESESFSKIESFGGTDSTGPAYFTVTTKDGKILEYGNTTDSKVLTDNGQSNMLWLLDKVTDQNGNYMVYHYATDNTNRNYLLTEIDYTGNSNTGLQPYNHIIFSYTNRQNWQGTKKYIGGASLVTPFIVSNITVQDQNGNMARSYNFTYSYNTTNNDYYLASTTETGSDGKTLNPTTFTYGNTTNNNQIASQSVNIYESLHGYSHAYTGDFDGDGKTDIMVVQYYVDNNGIEYDTLLSVLNNIDTIASNDPNPKPIYTARLPIGKPITIQTQKINNAFYGFYSSDYTGDGADDIIQTRTHLSNFTGSGYYPFQTLDSILLTSILRVRNNPGQPYQIVTSNLPALPTDSWGNSFIYFPMGSGGSTLQSMITGDFDGDGSTDYILMLGQFITPGQPSSGIYYKAFFNSPTKQIYNQEIWGFNVEGNYNYNYTATTIATADAITPIDLKGDGKSELMITRGDSTYFISVSQVSATTGYSYMGSVLYSTKAFGKNNTFYVGDFNGDKNADLLVRNSDGNTNLYAGWNIYYGTGASSGNPFSSPVPIRFTTNDPYVPTFAVSLPSDNNGWRTGDGAYQIDNIQITDIDGDGTNEITGLFGYNQSEPSNGLDSAFLNIAIPKGTTTINKIDTLGLTHFVTEFGYAGTQTGDFNGDGKSDIQYLYSADYGNAYYQSSFAGYFFYPNPFTTPNLLSQATNGFGVTTNFNYRALSDVRDGNTTFYQQSNYNSSDPSINFPFNTIKAPLFVVSSVTAPNGIGGTNSISYTYKDAILHRSGKNFLGFKGMTATNTTMGTTSNIINAINTQYAALYQTQQTTNLTSTGEQLSEQDITTSFVSKSTNGYFDMRFLPQINKTVSINYLTGTATETDNTYDAYGNITKSLNQAGGWSGNNINTIETATTNTVYGVHNTPVPAVPDKLIVQNQRNGQATVATETDFTYDAKGNIASKIADADKALAITTAYTYDGYGNAVESVTDAQGINTRYLKNRYDNQGRFVLKKEQPGSGIVKTQSYTYDSWGNPLTATSTDGLTTSYVYDGFGRNTQTTLPDGEVVKETLSWATGGSGNNANIVYIDYKYAPAGGQPVVKTAYDVLGRAIAVQSSGFGGQIINQFTGYDAKGNVVSQTAPAYLSEPQQITTTQYDPYNRAVQVTTPVTYVTTAYQKLSGGQLKITVTNAAGQAASKTTDGAGRMIAATDNGGQLNYTCDSRGNQTAVTIGNSVTLVTSTYDDYGRQTSLTDKNAGTITYQYDALGELTKQTDALNHVYTMTYDDFGRLVSKTGQEGTTTYTYYTSGSNNNDNPVKITGPAGDTLSYTYDNLGRETSHTTRIDGAGYTDNFQYNNLSQLVITSYADGITLYDTYDNNGIPALTTAETSNGQQTTLFSAAQMNSKGVYTRYTLGNGKTSTVDYDIKLGVPLRYYTQGIQDLNMAWNANTGNLMERKDAIKSLTEDFTYDNLNRLTGATVNSTQQQLAMTYDNTGGMSLGNIATKTDAGTYGYDAGRINAVSYVTNAGHIINQNPQTITYTPFLKVDSIWQMGMALKYTYGADQQRIKSRLVNTGPGTVMETRYYLGVYEKQIIKDTTRYIHYISAGNGLAAIAVVQNGVTKIYYVYSDHLGSILTLTDGSGNVVATQNFDAWGRYRNPTDWTYNNVPTQPTWLYRGYTGHESMAVGGLINMNGRVYDPVVGRMLSPDNNITYPDNTQGYNRYAYGLNNPLMFIDPTGNNFGSVMADIGAFIGLAGVGYIGASLISNGHVFSNVSSWQSNWWKGAITADLIAGSAVVGGEAIAGAAIPSIIAGAAEGVGGGVLSTAVGDAVTKQHFSVEQIMNQLFASTVSGAITGALSVGTIKDLLANEVGIPQSIINGSSFIDKTFTALPSNIVSSFVSTAGQDIGTGNWKHFANAVFSSFLGKEAGSFVTQGAKVWENNYFPLDANSLGMPVLNTIPALGKIVSGIFPAMAGAYAGQIITDDTNPNFNKNVFNNVFNASTLAKLFSSQTYSTGRPTVR